MTCSIRYYRLGRPEDAGLLIIATESDRAAHVSRLKVLGYVVLDNPTRPPRMSSNTSLGFTG
jgi:hypothetical protein